LQGAKIGKHETDGVIDFVRDAGGELPDGREFFRLQQLFLRPA
jgi:hypothetical protein